jgi:uncharacterized membrane protein
VFHGNATPERLTAFSDGVFAVLITVLILELRPPPLPTFGSSVAMAHMAELCGQLRIHRDRWANHHDVMRFAT